MSVAVIDANESPYETTKEAERNRGLYALYASRLNDESSLMIRETLYVLPVLSKECEDTNGR